MKQFEVGKTYGAYDAVISPVTVIKRMPKTIQVTNGSVNWRMRIGYDSEGNECMVDRKAPRKWHYAFTYSSKLEREWNDD